MNPVIRNLLDTIDKYDAGNPYLQSAQLQAIGHAAVKARDVIEQQTSDSDALDKIRETLDKHDSSN